MADCAHGFVAPDEVIEALPECQAGSGRHKCPVCSYNRGLAFGRGEQLFEGPAETCAQKHGTAPADMLRALPESQARLQRHRCCYLAYERGKEAGLEARRFLKAEQDKDEINRIYSSDTLQTTKEQLILARLGQGKFRAAVIELDSCCRVTGVDDVRFLRAGHIKPWRLSNDSEKLDCYNGLMLSPTADHLFDAGWFTFENDGSIRISDHLPKGLWARLGLAQPKARSFDERHYPYLSHHREHVFKK